MEPARHFIERSVGDRCFHIKKYPRVNIYSPKSIFESLIELSIFKSYLFRPYLIGMPIVSTGYPYNVFGKIISIFLFSVLLTILFSVITLLTVLYFFFSLNRKIRS